MGRILPRSVERFISHKHGDCDESTGGIPKTNASNCKASTFVPVLCKLVGPRGAEQLRYLLKFTCELTSVLMRM
jgi:hypothetical protein